MQNLIEGFPLNTRLEVRWADASTQSGWNTIEEYLDHGPAECVSMGYLLSHDKTSILLTQTQSVDGQANQALAIPSPWVLKIEPIGPVRYKEKAKLKPRVKAKAKK